MHSPTPMFLSTLRCAHSTQSLNGTVLDTLMVGGVSREGRLSQIKSTWPLPNASLLIPCSSSKQGRQVIVLAGTYTSTPRMSSISIATGPRPVQPTNPLRDNSPFFAVPGRFKSGL